MIPYYVLCRCGCMEVPLFSVLLQSEDANWVTFLVWLIPSVRLLVVMVTCAVGCDLGTEHSQSLRLSQSASPQSPPLGPQQPLTEALPPPLYSHARKEGSRGEERLLEVTASVALDSPLKHGVEMGEDADTLVEEGTATIPEAPSAPNASSSNSDGRPSQEASMGAVKRGTQDWYTQGEYLRGGDLSSHTGDVEDDDATLVTESLGVSEGTTAHEGHLEGSALSLAQAPPSPSPLPSGVRFASLDLVQTMTPNTESQDSSSHHFLQKSEFSPTFLCLLPRK